MAGNKRKIQEINAGSMADIAFLLLIFFLVATTMSNDKGIMRQLPPMPPEDMELEDNKVKQRNLMLVFVNDRGEVMAQDGRDQGRGQNFNIWNEAEAQRLTDKVKEFVLNPSNSEALPEMKEIELDLPDNKGKTTYLESSGVVSLQTTRNTNYDTYIAVQDVLTRAFNDVRDQAAMKLFANRKMSELSDDEKAVVTKAVKIKISEAEPRQKNNK
jgi:biopolymer transport protein ExbD